LYFKIEGFFVDFAKGSWGLVPCLLVQDLCNIKMVFDAGVYMNKGYSLGIYAK